MPDSLLVAFSEDHVWHNGGLRYCKLATGGYSFVSCGDITIHVNICTMAFLRIYDVSCQVDHHSDKF